MTKISAHVTGHPRHNYESFCRARPAVVLGLNEGGALLEVKQWSDDHTITIFRDTTVYLEAPGDINDPPGTYADMASYWYPELKAKWELNPADYYTITNEQGGGGDDLQSYRNLVNYEREIMKLANADGYKVCVLSLAGGSPDPITIWLDECVPFIREAFDAGNIYGRHAYENNWDRALVEAQYLLDNGLGYGGMAITEWGFDGGYGQIHDQNKIKIFDEWSWAYDNLIGFCIWELGHSGFNANFDPIIPYLTPWMEVNPTPKWEPGTPTPGETLDQHLWAVSLDAQTISLNPDAALQQAIYNAGYVPVGSETRTNYDDKEYALQPAEELTGRPRLVAVAEVPKWDQVYFINEPDDTPTPPTFELTHWPAVQSRITQRFGANPGNYDRFGLPGHDGVDIAANTGEPVKAAASGEVYRVHIENRDGSHNYGNHVRIQHQDDYRTIYAHFSDIPADINPGALVQGGQLVGYAGNTGNSTGPHLHFGMKHPPGDPGWPYDLINPEPYLLPLQPQPPAPNTFDMLSYMKADPEAWRVIRHSSGAQEDFRDMDLGGGWWAMVKNSLAEFWYSDGQYIYLKEDTSPGKCPSHDRDRCYKVNPGRWCLAQMQGGVAFHDGGHTVQFYHKDDCSTCADNSGSASNTTTVIRLERDYTFDGYGQNLTLDEVLFVQGNVETQIFARHDGRALGRVGWVAPWGNSEIVQLFWDRGVLKDRPKGCC